MTDDALAAIEARATAATAGPWEWTEDEWNAKAQQRVKEVGGRFRKRDLYLFLLQGPYPCYCPYDHADLPAEERQAHEARGRKIRDPWDHRVMALQWWQVRGTSFMGSPNAHDAAFIAAARTDVPALCAEVRRLQAALAAGGGDRMTDSPADPPAVGRPQLAAVREPLRRQLSDLLFQHGLDLLQASRKVERRQVDDFGGQGEAIGAALYQLVLLHGQLAALDEAEGGRMHGKARPEFPPADAGVQERLATFSAARALERTQQRPWPELDDDMGPDEGA